VPEVGSHRLRHTAACEMISAGAALVEVAQVLRHHSLQTTAGYANPRELHQMGAFAQVAC
jgi:site-specific recombinase XerD